MVCVCGREYGVVKNDFDGLYFYIFFVIYGYVYAVFNVSFITDLLRS